MSQYYQWTMYSSKDTRILHLAQASNGQECGNKDGEKVSSALLLIVPTELRAAKFYFYSFIY